MRSFFQFGNAEAYRSIGITASSRSEVFVEAVGLLFIVVNNDFDVMSDAIACGVDAIGVVELQEEVGGLVDIVAVVEVVSVEIGGDTDIAEVILPSIQNCEELKDADNQYKSVIANAFLGYKGDLIVCSASPEQDSWAAQTPFGSMDVFTYVFVSTFEGAIFDKSFTWPKFLTKLSETTTEVTKDMPTQGIQTPIYDYNLKRIREKDN